MPALPQSELDRRKKDAKERRERVQWQPGDLKLVAKTK